MTRYLSLDDLIAIVDELKVGPVRDLGLLDSAGLRPATSVWGEDAYPGIHTKAAVLLESLARNHPLVDGNKRLAWVAMVVFCGLNGLAVVAPEDEAYDLVIDVATGSIDYAAAAERIGAWTSESSAES